LAPQGAPPAGELDLDRAVVLRVDLAVPRDPALLLEAVEAAAEARWRDPHPRRHVLRSCPTVEIAECGEHLERAEWHRPLTSEVVVDRPVDIEHHALQVTP